MKITVNTKSLKGLGKKLAAMPGKERRAVTRAANRATQRTRTAILRRASGELGVTQKRLRRRVRQQRRDLATEQRPRSQVFLVISDAPVSWQGKPVQTPKGARVKGRVYDRSFVAKVGNHTGVFRRKMPGGGKLTAKQYQAIMMRGMTADSKRFRFPITEIKGSIRVPLRRASDDLIETVGIPEFRKQLVHNLKREFNL